MSSSASIQRKSCFAALPRTERGRPIVIGGDPKGRNFLYTHGGNIYIRNIENPEIVDIYCEHSKDTTVAKYSPSGFYIASGDTSGKIRIWDTVNPEHILKNEFPVLGGPIKDIAWSEDNTKICAVGAGSKYGSVFTADSGNSVGGIFGHAKDANTCDFRQQRPYKIATGGEDFEVIFHAGPPFKKDKAHKVHSNFVNALRYSPTGANFISVGADKKAFIFDGITGEMIGELGNPAHGGGLYALSYSPDGSHVMTVSADKTAKIWDVGTTQCVTEFKLGNAVEDMQVGCLWQGDHILTVSLSGHINYLDRNDPSRPVRIVKGHNKQITSMGVCEQTIYTGAADGKICYWDAHTGECEVISGKGHTTQVQDMIYSDGGVLRTIGIDDTVREVATTSNEISNNVLKVDSQPRGISARGGVAVVACINHVMVMQNGRKTSAINVKFCPQSVSIHPDMSNVAAAGENLIVIYNLSNGALSERKQIVVEQCQFNALQFSPDGNFLAAAGSDRNLHLYSVAEDYAEVFSSTGHQARVTCVSWSPDCSHIATSSIDCSIGIWVPKKQLGNKIATFKDPKSYANKIHWLDNNNLVTVGQDSNVKQWTVKF